MLKDLLAGNRDDEKLPGTAAFILGNSPYLPVADLGCLVERFTVGVNRIVKVFTPTVILWVDRTVYRDVGGQIDTCGALPVCDRSVKHRQGHIGLRTWTGENALRYESAPEVLCCNGNTGCCAARWALALGCRPVYLVGMEAQYADGKTDFYGTNLRHRREGSTCTLEVMRKELDRLLRDFSQSVFVIRDGETLREVAGRYRSVDQQAIKSHIRSMLAKRAVEMA